MQKGRNSSALAKELRLYCIKHFHDSVQVVW